MRIAWHQAGLGLAEDGCGEQSLRDALAGAEGEDVKHLTRRYGGDGLGGARPTRPVGVSDPCGGRGGCRGDRVQLRQRELK